MTEEVHRWSCHLTLHDSRLSGNVRVAWARESRSGSIQSQGWCWEGAWTDGGRVLFLLHLIPLEFRKVTVVWVNDSRSQMVMNGLTERKHCFFVTFNHTGSIVKES